MHFKPRVVFLGTDNSWLRVLRKALNSRAEIYRDSPDHITSGRLDEEYNLIIVDTLDIPKKQLFTAISCLKHRFPRAQVLVVSASPAWRAVREVLKAGAADYIVKSAQPAKVASDLAPYLSCERI